MNNLSTMLANAQRKQDEALEQLALDVRQAYEHHMQARGSGVMYGVELGNLLRRAKRALPHGQFGNWIAAQKFPFERAWATVCMQASEAYGYLIENQIATQVAICEGYESIRDLAAGRALAKEGKDPLTVQRVPRPKVKRPRVSDEEAEEMHREDVAAEVDRTVDEREAALIEREAKLAGADARVRALEARERACEEREAKAVLLIAQYTAKLAELEAREFDLAQRETHQAKTTRPPRKPAAKKVQP
jgi:hypothetical protein